MNELIRFAEDGNADQCFAIIDSEFPEHDFVGPLAKEYEQGILNDEEFCKGILFKMLD